MKIFDLNNQIQYPRFEAPFYEVYFLKFHLIEEGIAFWIRYTIHKEKAGQKKAALWAFAFDAQNPTLNQGALVEYSLDRVHCDSNIFHLSFGDYSLSNQACSGRVQDGKFSLQWDLQFEGKEASLKLFPYEWMYRWNTFPKTKYITTRPSIFFSGGVQWNGKEYKLNRAPGMQSHLWGSQHSKGFLWAHCNTFVEDPSAFFEIASPQVKIGSYLSPPLTMFYARMFGKEYCFNSPRIWFQKDIRRDLEEWNFDIQQGDHRFIGAVGTEPQQFLGVRYTDPQLGYRYCNHSEWAMASLEHYEFKGGRWCMSSSLHSKAATYEWLDSEPHPSVGVSVLG